jgi:hypothetical protein
LPFNVAAKARFLLSQLAGLELDAVTISRDQTHGTLSPANRSFSSEKSGDGVMNGIIYLVGLIVVIGVILSFFGLR